MPRKNSQGEKEGKPAGAKRDRQPESRTILLTGASGYVGSKLLGLLQRRREKLRCLARRPEKVLSICAKSTEVVEGDVFDAASLKRAMEGVDTAYYLIHCLHCEGDFEAMDRRAAENFASAAKDAGVKRIIYLGGLAEPGPNLSPHLRSRHEVGRILRECGVETVEFRASVVIGTGSLSFELVRALVERLTVMICPRWVRVPAQPIFISDVLAYLVAGLDQAPGESRIYEIGSPDRVSYAEIMQEYARRRKLSRLMIPVRVLTPGLSSLWLALVTPLYKRVGRRLIEGVRNPSVVKNHEALDAFPIRPISLRRAISETLANEERQFAEKPMSQLEGIPPGEPARKIVRVGNRILDYRAVKVNVGRMRAFAPVRRIGGGAGWYYGNRLWDIRGWLDILFGGPGFKRRRRDPDKLRKGDRIDCWQVEIYDPGHRLRLRAEMKLPGRAWLEFEVVGDERSSVIRQTAAFEPGGLAGLAYWTLVLPIHNMMFNGMLEAIAREAQSDRPAPSNRFACRPARRS